MRDELRDLATGYVLDALDIDERRAFEAEMEQSDVLRAEVDELRRTVAMIGHSAPPARPPESLRARILEQIGRPVEKAEATESAAADRPSKRASGRGRDRPDMKRREGAAPPTPRPQPALPASRAPWWLAAAAAVAAVVAGVAYLGERDARTDLESALADRDGLLESARAQLADRDALLEALVAPDIVTAALASPDAEPTARIFWNRRQQVALVTAFNLPQASAGRTYQLWGIDTTTGSAPVSLGTFDTAGDQTALLTVAIPAGATFDVAAVTDEPTGGSPQPTTTPFLVGSFQAN